MTLKKTIKTLLVAGGIGLVALIVGCKKEAPTTGQITVQEPEKQEQVQGSKETMEHDEQQIQKDIDEIEELGYDEVHVLHAGESWDTTHAGYNYKYTLAGNRCYSDCPDVQYAIMGFDGTDLKKEIATDSGYYALTERRASFFRDGKPEFIVSSDEKYLRFALCHVRGGETTEDSTDDYITYYLETEKDGLFGNLGKD